MEILIAEFFHFSSKIIGSFVLSSLPKIHLSLETFQRFSPNLLNFQWPFSTEVEIKRFFKYHVIT